MSYGEQFTPAGPEAFGTAQLSFPNIPEAPGRLLEQHDMTVMADLSAEQIARVPELFDTRLNEITQAHLHEFLSQGEPTADQQDGSIRSEQAFTAAALLLKGAMQAGNGFDNSMVVTMQFLARLNAAVRQKIDITDCAVTNVAADDLVNAAKEDWSQLVRQEITAVKTEQGKAQYALRQQPTVANDRTGAAQQLATPRTAQLPNSSGLWIAGGGGGDIYTTAFLAQDVFKQEDPTLVSVWGKPENIRGATPIGDSGRIFRADAETVIENTRHMEHLVAARGLQTIIVCFDPRRDQPEVLADDFLRLADHLQTDPSHVALVDTGGDMLATPRPGQRLDRDHSSMRAALNLQEHLGTALGNLFIATPGVDAPENMDEIAQAAGMQAYDLSPYAKAFYNRAAEDGVISSDRKLYSRMVQSMWYALHPRTIAEQAYVTQPLLLPKDQALKPVKARPAFTTVTEQMHYLHHYDLRRAAEVIGVA